MLEQQKPIWETDFFPDEGENASPIRYIKSLPRKDERAQIYRRIKTLAELEPWQWPAGWVKNLKSGLYQLKSGDHRIYIGIAKKHPKRIVICYACRKQGQKAKPQDIQNARINLNAYYLHEME